MMCRKTRRTNGRATATSFNEYRCTTLEGLGADIRLPAYAAVEPAMPLDAAIRSAAHRSPHTEFQPPQAIVLAHDEHARRSHSGDQAVVPGGHQPDDLEL